MCLSEGEYSIIGTLNANGNLTAATLVMKGGDLKRSKDYFRPKNYKSTFGETVGVALGLDAPKETRDALFDAIESTYVALQYEATGGHSEDMDEAIFEKAVEQVIGGTNKTDGGFTVLAPKRGMQQDEFEEWMDDLNATDFPNLSTEPDAHGKGADFKEIIVKAKESKMISAGKGVYYFKDASGTPLMGNDGKPLMLLYREGR